MQTTSTRQLYDEYLEEISGDFRGEIGRLKEALYQIQLHALSFNTGFPVVKACEHLAKMAHDALNDTKHGHRVSRSDPQRTHKN